MLFLDLFVAFALIILSSGKRIADMTPEEFQKYLAQVEELAYQNSLYKEEVELLKRLLQEYYEKNDEDRKKLLEFLKRILDKILEDHKSELSIFIDKVKKILDEPSGLGGPGR